MDPLVALAIDCLVCPSMIESLVFLPVHAQKYRGISLLNVGNDEVKYVVERTGESGLVRLKQYLSFWICISTLLIHYARPSSEDRTCLLFIIKFASWKFDLEPSPEL